MAELLHHQLGGVGVQHLRHGGHHAHLHQRLDHVRRAGGHAGGEIGHRDRVGQHDLAHDFHLIGAQRLQLLLPTFALALAADRGEAANAVVLALNGGLHVDAAGAATVVDDFLGRHDRRLAGRHAGRAAGATDRTVLVLLLAGAGGFKAQRLVGRRGCRTRSRRRPQRAAGRVTGDADRRRRGGRRGFGRGQTGLLLGAGAGLRLYLAAGFFLGRLTLLVLAAARLLGGRQDRDLLLLAAFGLALGGVALLLDQRALPCGQLGLGQRAARAGRRAGDVDRGAHRSRRRAGRRTWKCGGVQRRVRRALLAYFDLHDLGPAVGETLSYRTGVDGLAQLAAALRSQREPALGRVLVVAFAHELA